MAHSFVPRLDGRYMCRLDDDERAVLCQVATEVLQLIRSDLGLNQDSSAALTQQALASEDPLERLEAEQAAHTLSRAPRDEAVQRLLPDAFPGDDEASEDFRRLCQPGLADSIVETLSTVIATITAHGLEDVEDELIIDREQADHFLRALTTIRLVLADRMSLKNDGDYEALHLLRSNDIGQEDAEEKNGQVSVDFLLSLYDFLSWLQESLVLAMSTSFDR